MTLSFCLTLEEESPVLFTAKTERGPAFKGQRLMEQIEPRDRTCVVVGSLNPGIIQPEWLQEVAGIEMGEVEWKVDFDPGTPTPTFRSRQLEWLCRHDRLFVASLDGTDPGEAVTKVFEVLVHTPVRAVGNNFSFFVHDQEMQERLSRLTESAAVECLKSLGHEVDSYVTSFRTELNAAQVNLKVENTGNLVKEFKFNFHRVTASAKVAALAAGEWKADFHAAEELLGAIRSA